MSEEFHVGINTLSSLERTSPPLDGILLLGKGLLVDPTAKKASLNRSGYDLAEAGAALYRLGETKKLYPLGGHTAGELYSSEAELTRDVLSALHKIPSEAMGLETHSSDTHLNIVNFINEYMLGESPPQRLGLLTSDTHLMRAKILMHIYDLPYVSLFSTESVRDYVARQSEDWWSSPVLHDIHRQRDATLTVFSHETDSEKAAQEIVEKAKLLPKSPNMPKSSVQTRLLKEEVYTRALFELPENWLHYVADINDAEWRRRILKKFDKLSPGRLKQQFGIDPKLDGDDDLWAKLRGIEQKHGDVTKWAGQAWPPSSSKQMGVLLGEQV